MSGVVIFAVVFVVFFILRAVAATITFYYLLPDTNRCPLCDEPTLRVREPAWNRILPWFRTSWCYSCGWEGFLRSGPAEPASSVSHSGQLPVSSKKSS